MPLSLAVFLVFGLRFAGAQPNLDDAHKLIQLELDKSEVVQNLEYMSDHIGPRLTGTARLKRANDWTAQKMQEYGLENVHLEGWEFGEGWERGRSEGRIAEPNGLPLTIAQGAWSPPTKGMIRGKVARLTAEDDQATFDALKGKLKGAIIFNLKEYHAPNPAGLMGFTRPPDDPPIPALVRPTPSAAGTTSNVSRPFNFEEYLARLQKFNDFLAKEGVGATISVSSKPYGLLDMTGSPVTKWGRMGVPWFFISNENGGQIDRLLRHGETVTLELRGDGKFVKGPVTANNTVGEIRGSEKPDELVVLGAHLDSWDLGTGTTDNGTGSMAVLEAARLIKAMGVKPKRTIRFILFSGEEQGLLGSEAYVKAHKDEMEKINAVFVHDIGTGRVKGAWLQERAECKPLLETRFNTLKSLGLMTDEPTLSPGKMNGTDHASFDDAGVPAFAFMQASAEYGLSHHSQADTFERVRPDDLKQGALMLAIFAWDAATMDGRYPRKGK